MSENRLLLLPLATFSQWKKRWFCGRVFCALDYEAGDPGLIPGSSGTTNGYPELGGDLTGYCCKQYRPRLDNRGGNDTHHGLCWK